MITLIIKKLQSQRLDALAHKSYDTGSYSAQKLSKSSHLFCFETNTEEHRREDVGGGRPVGSQVAMVPASPFLPGPRGLSVGTFSARSPSVLPTKRPGRSLSEPDERASGGSPRHPGGPRVWTPVTKRRCHSGGSAWLPGRAFPAISAASPPAPWPASASGRLPAPGPGRPPAGARTPSPRRCLSLAQERLVPAGAAPPSAGSARRVHARAGPPPGPVPLRLAGVRARTS